MAYHGVGRSVKHGIGRLRATASSSPPRITPSPSSFSPSIPLPGKVDDDKGETASPLTCSAAAGQKATSARTHLTEISHTAPTRLIPIRSSCLQRSGSALCAVSSYGGGMVTGDRCDLNIAVERDAMLGVVTQGHTRIYRCPKNHLHRDDDAVDGHGVQKQEGEENVSCHSTLRANVGYNSLLVIAPDPVVPFADSSYQQTQRIRIDRNDENEKNSEGTIILVDWFGAGRVANGERWMARNVSSHTALHWNDDPIPFVVEAVSLDRRTRQNRNEFHDTIEDPFGLDIAATCSSSTSRGSQQRNSRFDAFASVIIHGPLGDEVAARFVKLGQNLASEWTRIREENYQNDNCHHSDDDKTEIRTIKDEIDLHLAGRVVLGVTEIEHSQNHRHKRHLIGHNTCSTTHVARMVATTNEDMYRVLHACLKPLRDKFGGLEFYRDRIHASSSSSLSSSSTTAHHAAVQQSQPTESHARRTFPRKHITLKSTIKSIDQSEKQTTRNAFQDHMSSSWWRIHMLADSALPIGGFAHSSGLEAASQLGLFLDSNNDKKNNSNSKGAIASTSSNSTNRSSNKVNPDKVSAYIQAMTKSNVQLLSPFVYAGHDLILNKRKDIEELCDSEKNSSEAQTLSMRDRQVEKQSIPEIIYQKWVTVDQYARAVMAPNGPACRASLDQGEGLLRVALQWLRESRGGDDDSSSSSNDERNDYQQRQRSRRSMSSFGLAGDLSSQDALLLLELIQQDIMQTHGCNSSGHAGPIYGIVGGLLGLSADETCRVLGYCTARDMVSAAVRLNLVGPMAGVTMLDNARVAVEDGIHRALASLLIGSHSAVTKTDQDPFLEGVTRAAGCAPLADSVQPCHDLLAVRLFRT